MANRWGSNRSAMRRNNRAGILNTFKESVPDVGAVLCTKDDNFKDILQNLQ